MNDQLLGPLVESWLKDSDSPPSDIGRSTAQIESRLPRTRQWSRWWPLPYLERLSAPEAGHAPAGGSSMFSAVKFIAAAVIVALFGGFLLSGILTTPQDEEVLPATVIESPSPMTGGEQAFPTGTFESDAGSLTLEFRPDGTCVRAGIPCTFGVRGGFYVEMTFEDPSGAQVPAVYRWDFDGQQLTFEPHGQDLRPNRRDTYADHTYRLTEGGEPLVTAAETGFPVGRLVPADGRDTPTLLIRNDGTIGLPYAYNGDLFTEFYQERGEATVPATYRWRWDGERLSFLLWGEDANAYRRDLYGHVYVLDEVAVSLAETRSLLLSDPRLDVWVRVLVTQGDDGRYEASATTTDEEPLGEGVGDTLQEAVKAALESLGEPYASDMAESVEG